MIWLVYLINLLCVSVPLWLCLTKFKSFNFCE